VKYGPDGKTLASKRYAVAELLEDCENRPQGHSKKLGANIIRLELKRRPNHVEAHHIVSSTAALALPSRLRIFAWHIGINDADNGVFLPGKANVKVRGLSKAPWHRVIHTPTYHSRVYARLLQADKNEPEAGRLKLREMKVEMQRGKFRYT